MLTLHEQTTPGNDFYYYNITSNLCKSIRFDRITFSKAKATLGLTAQHCVT